MFFKQIKLLNVSVSCIQVAFKKLNELNKKTCLVDYLTSAKGHEDIEEFREYDKLLMFEIDSNI